MSLYLNEETCEIQSLKSLNISDNRQKKWVQWFVYGAQNEKS